MYRIIMLNAFFIPFLIRSQVAFDLASYPVYQGKDLGLVYQPDQSTFRIWAPTASKAELILYNEATGGSPFMQADMKKSIAGTWTSFVRGNLKGKFYVFRVLINGQWSHEVPDPYAQSVGVNGKRAMIVDMTETNPMGWNQDKGPALKSAVDAVVYELHVRDASIAASSGIKNKGKFLGLAEQGTKNEQGLSTGLDHLKELGVTHIHLLPFL